MWRDREMQWLAAPSGKRDRSQTFSDATIQFCLSIKCLFGLALRQALELVESTLRPAGLDWPIPVYSTVCRRQKTLQAQIADHPSAEPLQLLVDSTGGKFLGEGEWKRKKHGAEYRREWRKVHLGIDAQTREIRAVEVTSNAISAAPMLPELLAQIAQDEAIARVTADGAHDKRTCRDAIAPCRNARLWRRSSPGSESPNEAVRACQRLGHGTWQTWSGYHRYSLVEIKCTA